MKKLSFVVLLFSFSCYFSEDIPRQSTTTTVDPNLCVGSTLTATTTSVATTGCGSSDGSITVTATGGTPPYQYALGTGAPQSSNVFSSLKGGSYGIIVYDSNPCSFSLNNVNVSNANSTLAASASTTDDSGCLIHNGAATLSATGGTPPYTYSFNTSAASATTSYNNLAAGSYDASVTDNSGCSINMSVVIKKISSVSYSGFISPLITTYCTANSTCHGAGGSQVNFTVYQNCHDYAAMIKSKTADKSMPKAVQGKTNSLTADQIAQIACWVDEGALNN